ncbi:MAG: hypothetical protein COV30_02375, partial [Candidatus Yanofskybacteria bacterium CG10_big_fil_rev_8_21_14_0_10_37_15]
MKLLITTKTVDENDQLLGFFVEWIRLLSKKFEKITVLCLEKGKFELPENVKVINLGKYRGLSKLRTLFSLYFTSFNLRGEYDAVFVHMNPIWMISGGALWKIMRKKCFFWYTSGGVTLKLKIAEKFADTIFTASPESFRLKSNKVIVTGHGIDTELFKPVRDVRNDGNVGDIQFEQAKRSNNSNNSIKILSVGRIAPVKNYETLIEASKILKDKGENFSVTIIGEAPPLKKDTNYKTQITNKIKELGLENNFEFLGKINHKDLPQYYQSHDIFVHLSKTGSLDKTILEAMACGMNVLSSSDSSRAFLKEEL